MQICLGDRPGQIHEKCLLFVRFVPGACGVEPPHRPGRRDPQGLDPSVDQRDQGGAGAGRPGPGAVPGKTKIEERKRLLDSQFIYNI